MNRITLQFTTNQIKTCSQGQRKRLLHSSTVLLSSQQNEANSERKDEASKSGKSTEERSDKKPRKTQAQLDADMQAAMEGHAGDGGLAGAEFEGGKAVSMKRGVRDNMFRYI